MKRARRASLSEFELDLVLATQTAEREAQREYERQSLHPAYGRGYDSERWPFDIKRAIASSGYRKGIRKAILNPWYNRQWRHAALHELHSIVDPIIAERENAYSAYVRSLSQYYGI